MPAADAALEAALQLRLTLGAVLALLVARPVGCLAAGRARRLRAHETGRYHEGGQGDREEQSRRGDQHGPAAFHRWAPGRLVGEATVQKRRIAAYCYGPHHERTLNASPGGTGQSACK